MNFKNIIIQHSNEENYMKKIVVNQLEFFFFLSERRRKKLYVEKMKSYLEGSCMLINSK